MKFSFFEQILRSPEEFSSPDSHSPQGGDSSSSSSSPAPSPSPSSGVDANFRGGNEGTSTRPLSSSDFDFNGFDVPNDDDAFDFGSAVEGGGNEQPNLAPATAPVQPPPAPVAPQVQPQVPPPSTQTQPVAQQQPTAAPLNFASDPQAFLSKLVEHREALIDSIAQERFSFSDEEKLLLDSQPSEVLPKMAARLFYDAITTSLNRMIELVPAMIGQYNIASEQASRSEQAFFSKWPQLNPKDHMAEVLRFGQLWRQANPRGTSDQFINDVGMLVAQSLGLGLTGAPQQNRQAPPQQRPAQSSSFRPAMGQSGGMPNSTPIEELWSGLGLDFD